MGPWVQNKKDSQGFTYHIALYMAQGKQNTDWQVNFGKIFF